MSDYPILPDTAPGTAVEPLVTFQEEAFSDVLPELQVHWEAHRHEVGPRHIQMVLDVDIAGYRVLEAHGQLSVVTMRVDEELVGYFISVVHPHLHYQQTLCAYNDVFYITPTYRRGWLPVQLFRHAEMFLQARGAQMLFADDKVWKDVGPIFKRCGWQPMGTLYSKWIGA